MKLTGTPLVIAVTAICAATGGYLLAKLNHQRSMARLSAATSNRLVDVEIKSIRTYHSMDGRTFLWVDGRVQECELELLGAGATRTVRLVSVNRMRVNELLDPSTANGKELISALHAALKSGKLADPSDHLAADLLRWLGKGGTPSLVAGS